MLSKIRRLIAIRRMSHQLDARLAERRAERTKRAEAAHRGVSTEWQRRGALCRDMFGEAR